MSVTMIGMDKQEELQNAIKCHDEWVRAREEANMRKRELVMALRRCFALGFSTREMGDALGKSHSYINQLSKGQA